MNDEILYAVEGGVGTITLNRPQALNALNSKILSELLDAMQAFDADPQRAERFSHDAADLFVDLSKNRSRRYCDRGCGNRANVAAYRARKAAESVS